MLSLVAERLANHDAGGCWKPDTVPDDIRSLIDAAVIPTFEKFLRPAPRQSLALRIATLLTHYYVPEMDPAAQLVVADDWVRLLSPYPLPVVTAVMDDWLRQYRQKPTIADLITNCETLVARPRLHLRLVKQLVGAS